MRRSRTLAAAAALFPEFANVPPAGLREGLLRAPPRGRAQPPCLSLVASDGFEQTAVPSPSGVLAERGWERPDLLARAAAARRSLVAARVGGAWWTGGETDVLPAGDDRAVVAFDAGVPADALAAAMLGRAQAEFPAERVVIVADAATRRRLRRSPGIAVIAGPTDPWQLLDRAARVYSAGGEIGFLALIADLPVSTFAAALYTGWGASDDAPGVPRQPFRRSVDEIFAGACLVAARYRDPYRNRAASFEETLAILGDWRRLDEANRRIAVCVGMSFWKRRRVADLVRSSAGDPVFRRTAPGAVKAAQRRRGSPGAIAAWASRLPPGLAVAAARDNVPLIRVEDGFIRSVGLGSDFLPRASLVCDARGIYFDPRQASDLETLLRETAFDAALLARARRLASLLVTLGITKYNLAGADLPIEAPADRHRILVPGQVEDDLSIRLGGGDIRSNLALLRAVRASCPDAFILYKPHPDVAAGHRAGAVPEREARMFADRIVHRTATAALLGAVDEVHTMTSLAGFEALLRQRRVVVYGRPFYAGWGLTHDRALLDRGRRLTLDELVAGTLILYPRYLDPVTRLPCGPEVIIERLERPELWRPGVLVLARRLPGAAARRFGEVRAMLPIAGSAPARGLSGPPHR